MPAPSISREAYPIADSPWGGDSTAAGPALKNAPRRRAYSEEDRSCWQLGVQGCISESGRNGAFFKCLFERDDVLGQDVF